MFRYNRGRSEDRWMDEHIVVDGSEVQLSGELLDDNKKSLSWWIEKHNQYASREVVEILDAEYKFFARLTKRTFRAVGTQAVVEIEGVFAASYRPSCKSYLLPLCRAVGNFRWS